MTSIPPIEIPPDLVPIDGRFGCGPSRIHPEILARLARTGRSYMGTSHRQSGVRNVVGEIRARLRTLFNLPEGWEVVLGNGGSTVFWDVATFGLIEHRSQHLVFGEFSSKFAEAATSAPHIGHPTIIESEPGTHPMALDEAGIDIYALTHNETSTGVKMDLKRPAKTGLVVVDATSGAGGLRWSPDEVDVYYFAPQKCFASDGGLWVACCSPGAVARIERLAASDRWVPASLDIKIALDNSRLNQTYNTPALATLFFLNEQLKWMLKIGGLESVAKNCEQKANAIYGWAERSSFAEPFVKDPAQRSSVVATIDLDGVDANTVSAVLRANGIVDTESYRKLGRNQLRVGIFPAVELGDVLSLTRCVDHVVAALS